QERSLAAAANPVTDIQSFAKGLAIQLDENFDGILQVAIDHPDVIAGGKRQPGGYSRLVPEIAAEANAQDPGIPYVFAGDDGERVVAAAIVHTDDVPGSLGSLLQLREHGLEEGRQHLLLVVTGHDQAESCSMRVTHGWGIW